MKPRQCDDNNPKIVLRKYDWDGQIVEFSLCKSHLQDPDFDYFVSEEKLEVLANGS